MYTNAWNVTDPPGTEQAKNIDNHIRKLRIDLGERLADLVVDVLADPLVLKPQYLGNVVGKQLVIPFSAFNSNTSGKETNYNTGCITAFTDTGGLSAPVILPPGCTITKVELLADKGDATNVTWDLYYRAFATGGSRGAGSQSAQISAANVVEAGIDVRISSSLVIAIVVAAGFMYYINVEANGSAGNSFDLYGARVTYNTPDGRITI